MSADTPRRSVVTDSRPAEIDRELERLVREMVTSTEPNRRLHDTIYYLARERAALLRSPRRPKKVPA